MNTDYRIGAKVEGQDGQFLGEVKHLVINQATKEFTHLVVGSDLADASLKLVEVSSIGTLSENKGTVKLNLTTEQFTGLPEFDGKAMLNEKGYTTEATKPINGAHLAKEGETVVGGGYTADPDMQKTPPGLVDFPPPVANQSK